MLLCRLQLFRQPFHFVVGAFGLFPDLSGLFSFPLILAVLSEDVLLLPNQCRWGNQILWSIRIIRLFFGELFFLIRSPADVQPILIQLFFFFL